MCSWTLEKVLGLTLVNRDSQFPGFHFTPVTRCFTLALCSVLSLFLASVLHSLLRFLPFIPAGCSGSSISSVTGSVFSKALSSLVEHPAPTRSHCYSPGETWESGKAGKEGKRRRSRVSYHSWKTQLPQKAKLAFPGQAPSKALPTSDLRDCEVPAVAGRASQLADLATFAEPRGSFVTGVSHILLKCQEEPTMSDIVIKNK